MSCPASLNQSRFVGIMRSIANRACRVKPRRCRLLDVGPIDHSLNLGLDDLFDQAGKIVVEPFPEHRRSSSFARSSIVMPWLARLVASTPASSLNAAMPAFSVLDETMPASRLGSARDAKSTR